MQLYFETYLIIALFFVIFTLCISGLYLRSIKHIIGFSALGVVLGAILPYILIYFQRVIGSLNPGITKEELDILMNGGCILYRPIPEIALHYFIDNIGFIILSILIGTIIGILIHLLLKTQKVV